MLNCLAESKENDDEKEESTVLLLKFKFYDKKSYDYFSSIRERYEKIKDGLVEKINKAKPI